jgi:predicted transcriptional regulator
MTRTQAIDTIKAKLDELTTEQLAALADIADAFARDVPDEDDATRAAIAEGIAQADRGEFATDDQVKAAFARFRS